MDTPIIDLTVFADLKETAGSEFVDDLVDTFLEEAPGMFVDLHQARTHNDAERFRRAAHSLKTNANTFGAARLAQAARALELGGLDPDSARNTAALAAEWESAAAALKALRNA